MTDLDDDKWMREALLMAKRAYDLGEVPVGAVVVVDNEMIGRGWNQPIGAHDPTAHAEIVAIRQACKKVENYRLVNAKLYVTIEPCTMCYGALIHSRVSEVIFGALEPKAGVFQSHSILNESQIYNHSLIWRGGILEARCAKLIQRFFRERRREKKKEKSKSLRE